MYYTTIEQSKKLLELGLKPESADMYYEMIHGDKYPQLVRVNLTNRHWMQLCPGVMMPCWSLGALLELMPKYIYTPIKEELGLHIFYIDDRWNFEYGYSNNSYSVLQQDEDLLNSAYNMIVWLFENKYIK
jgi:hypothetical protein